MKTLFSKVAFLNDQKIFLINLSLISGCYKSRLPFLSVGFGWQWISEGLSYIVCELSVQICKLKNWTPVTFKWLSCVALLACIILHINGKQFRCSVFAFVQYIIEWFSQPLHIINKLGHFMSILPTVILTRWKEPNICQNSI